ncbi:MAG: PadR family transcriptional regulator [Chloroflexi bacterium]|nr:PadR family transcriptional regulator [Chloroflexota bacterium]
MSQQLDDHIPLTPAVLHILLALSDGEKHGYGIMQEVSSITGGQITMGPGTLYGTLKRLLKSGLIVETSPPAGQPAEDERRRYYRLTAFGASVLDADLKRMAQLLTVAEQKRAYGGAS